MADIITITEQDVTDAENILEQFLTDRLPTIDFSKGSAMRDFVVVALSNVFAYLRAERDITRARQSLLLLGKLTGTDVDDAVDEILSNWFVFRKQGRTASGRVTIYFSQQTDVTIPTTAKFYKTSALVFDPDSLDDLLYSADDMLPVIDSEGEVVAYTIDVPLVAAQSGATYNIEIGTFEDYTRFNPYITRVENAERFTGGGGIETTAEMLERAETAISVRDLNSARSIDATLKDQFEEVDDVIVVGYGEPEMIRDLVIELATNTRIHAGGHVDAYIRSPILEGRTFEGIVGGAFTDPREEYYVFRDPSIVLEGDGGIPDTDFDTYNIVQGDVIKFHNAITTNESDLYIINRVTPYGLYVSRRSPFTKAMPENDATYTDGKLEFTGGDNTVDSEDDQYTFVNDTVANGGDIGRYIRVTSSANPRYNIGTGKITAVDTGNNRATVEGFSYNFVTETDVTFALVTRPVLYTIGDNGPDYNDKISQGAHTAFTGNPRYSGEFTKTVQNDGRILLPNVPIYRITDVSMDGTGFPGGLLDTDGRVRFPNRVNIEPTEQITVENLEYQVIGNNPSASCSGWQLMELDVGWAADKAYFNEKTLRVTYDTISAYSSIWAFMLATDRRILCGSVIPKGLHPLYITLNIRYKLSKTATAPLDTTEAAEALVDHVNNFDVNNDLDISDITSFLRENYSEIGYIEPTSIYYQLLAPDGRIIYYKTTGEISVAASKVIDPRTDVAPNPTDPTADQYQFEEPLSQGVSDNTVRYLTATDLITFTDLEA